MTEGQFFECECDKALERLRECLQEFRDYGFAESRKPLVKAQVAEVMKLINELVKRI